MCVNNLPKVESGTAEIRTGDRWSDESKALTTTPLRLPSDHSTAPGSQLELDQQQLSSASAVSTLHLTTADTHTQQQQTNNLLPSTLDITIHYYYSVAKSIQDIQSTVGRRLQGRTDSTGSACGRCAPLLLLAVTARRSTLHCTASLHVTMTFHVALNTQHTPTHRPSTFNPANRFFVVCANRSTTSSWV